jgi:hypothetical protein
MFIPPLLLFAALQDNLLLKLLDMGEEFLRLGKPESVDSRIQPYVFHNGKAPGTCWRYTRRDSLGSHGPWPICCLSEHCPWADLLTTC